MYVEACRRCRRCVCMFFPIFDIFDIHSITARRCIWSIFDIFDIQRITFKWYHIKKGMIKVCLYVLFPSSTSSTYIGFDGMVGKLSVSAFQNFFWIKNPLSINEVMSQNVCLCSFPIFYIFDIHSLTPLMCTLSIFDIFDMLWSFVQYSMHSMLCISTPPTSNNVHWYILARAL